MAVLELKLRYVKVANGETTVGFVLNVCSRETRSEDGQTKEYLRRTTRRVMERTVAGSRTPAQCVAALLSVLREKAAEEGHETFQ